jgi:hypothetical protein
MMARRQTAVQNIVKHTGGFSHARSIVLANWEQEPLVNQAHNIPWITKGAAKLLREFAADEKPFFLMTTPTGIHAPWHAATLDIDLRYTPGGYEADVYDYAPSYDELRESVADLTSGEKHKHVGMADIDHQVWRIRRELEALGLADSTVVIYTADHGIEPGKASVYDRGLRVPMLVYWPGLTRPASVTESLVQHPDLTATIARVAGVHDVMDGLDIRPVLAEPTVRVRDYAYFECGYSRAITDGRFKYVSVRLPRWMIANAEAQQYKWMTVGMGAGSGSHAAFSQLAYPDYYEPDQLYDLAADPFEQKSVWDATEHAAAQLRMCEAMKRYAGSFDHPFPVAAQPFFFSATYLKIAARTRAENNPHERFEWVKRDHDRIPWPPERAESISGKN